MELDPDFAALLVDHDLAELDRDGSSIVGVSADLRIRYTNEGWRIFAMANHGEAALTRSQLGTPLLGAISGELARFYRDLFAAALDSTEPLGFEYTCSTPELFRTYYMQVFPLRRRGLLITHSLHRIGPHPPSDRGPDTALAEYLRPDGIAVQCGNCRRWRHPVTGAWEWVPHLLSARYAEVSHGVCEPCAAFHYPPLSSG